MLIGWTRKVDIRVLAIIGLLVTVGLLLGAQLDRPWPMILEFGLYLGCLLLLATYQPLRQVLSALPRPQRRSLLCLTGVMLAAQIINQPHDTFPFIPWAMYSRRLPDPPRFFEYVGICDDGREVEIPAARVFRSHHRTVPWRLAGRWRLMHSAEDATLRAEQRQLYRSLLAGMVRRFNEQHPESEVRRVRVVECTMPRPAPGLKLEVARRPLREFTIK